MFTGEQFLLYAQVASEADTEAAWRTAISRAYYAAFWVAREVIESGGVSAPRNWGESSHDSLWDMLMTDYDATGKSLGTSGRTLKMARIRADYRARAVSRFEAQKAVADATRLLADLRALT